MEWSLVHHVNLIISHRGRGFVCHFKCFRTVLGDEESFTMQYRALGCSIG